MAGRMSNRDRIASLRAEADATAKEKEAASAAKAAQPPAARKSSSRSTGKAAPKSTGRVRMIWNVCDSSGKPVQQFPYAQEQEAIAEAAARTEKTGKPHFVNKGEVSVP